MSKPTESLEAALQSFGKDDLWFRFRPWRVRAEFRAVVWELAQAAAARKPKEVRDHSLREWRRVCQPEP